MHNPDQKRVEISVKRALEEDIGLGDVTGELIDSHIYREAKLICREESILCGSVWFEMSFRLLDPNSKIEWKKSEGDLINKDDVVAHIEGSAKCMVASERTGLNFLQMMSGIAYKTHCYKKILENSKTILLDTRKTLPGLRYEQKYSVLTGGGQNHRMGLYDAALIKENHISSAGSISQAIQALRNNNIRMIEVEVENLDELKEAIESKADIAMLDNFNEKDILKAVTMSKDKIKIEISGNIDKEKLHTYKSINIDYVSSGDLTKNISATDYSLIFN